MAKGYEFANDRDPEDKRPPYDAEEESEYKAQWARVLMLSQKD